MASDTMSGWQTVFADLSIILFMTTALAVNVDSGAKPETSKTAAGRSEASPVAVWRKTTGGETLLHWLTFQGRDPRIRFTFIVQYRRGAAEPPQEPLMELAQSLGREVRIKFEPSETNDVTAIAGYDGQDTVNSHLGPIVSNMDRKTE